MIGDSAPGAVRKSSALLAIAVGGLLAGTLDLTQAGILFGWHIPLAIAAGLLGRQAFHPRSKPSIQASAAGSILEN
jgi:hypothetical protein